MVMKIGVVGVNEGNGHPFSFSSIINGYESRYLLQAGWDLIEDYLRIRDPSEFGFENIKVTHAWSQDFRFTKLLCQACKIPHPVQHLNEMSKAVDAVIIARDDYKHHMELAMPFLKKGLPVFVDKPLSLIPTELQLLKPYLLTGQLMSCSAMRYAKELDEVRNNIHAYGELPVIRGIGPNLWETYGIHLLEAIVSTTDIEATSVLSLNAAHSSIVIQTETEGVVHIDTVESVKGAKGYSLPFQVDFWGTKMHTSVNIKDNFSMFRRMLWHFFHSISTGKPAINSNETLHILKTLIAGRISKLQNRKVYIHEVNI